MLEPGSLKHLLQALEADPEAGMAGGHIQNPDGSEQGGGRRDVPSPWRAFVRASGLYRLEKFWPELFPDFHLHKKPLPDKPIEVEATAGAMMLVRREALQEVGGWDEGYFLHCEDLYLCMRFRQKGWRILFVPDAKAIHYQGTCSQARPIFVAWHKHKGMIRFYKKFLKKVHAHFIRQRLVIKKPASDQIEPVFKANTSQDRISRIVRQYAYRAISGQYYRFHDRVCTRC